MADDLPREGILVRQLQGMLRGRRIVEGTVGSTGAVVTGDEFTVTKNGTGDYTITFDNDFSIAPSANATPLSAAARFTTLQTAPTTTQVRFLLFTSAAAAVDSSFSFIVVGLG